MGDLDIRVDSGMHSHAERGNETKPLGSLISESTSNRSAFDVFDEVWGLGELEIKVPEELPLGDVDLG